MCPDEITHATFDGTLVTVHTIPTASVAARAILTDDTIASAASAYNTQWLAPTAVVAPRLAKVSLTFDF